ncbi:Crp/Fnr family transcriptional regulator [Pedobacter cryoconitis]|uniref:CRP-like cAMP-binding protein n=1 Tax=Pedobacter cryoconitis TaxID=188932 RepID=A0A327T404_9SPHI|nr:Crp/Fnr family transcriptional regulator [Pedobacter cryoconitis]RAJ35602.1 CRP-like cAMP-binding protein [Pedobacter cryoconitis]
MYKQALSDCILKRITISQPNLDTVLSYFKEQQVDKEEVLLAEGESSKRMYFVKSGCLRIYFLQADGAEATRYLAFENNFATGLTGFISQQPSQENIQALEKTEVLYIAREDFYTLLDQVPEWGKFYRSYLEAAYVTNTKRLMSFITMDATTRYQSLIAEYPTILQRLSNRMVANYLGISQEALSRLKHKLLNSKQ